MDIEWKWDEDIDFLGDSLPADTLDREKYANFLYKICAARGDNSSLVVNVNAEWGAGKTYFTKRLAKSISDFHPTIYIDAWKEDFSDDPLLTIFSAIKEQLIGQSDKFTTLLNQTIENIGPLLKTATPIILEGLVKKYTGIENLSDLTKDLSNKLLDLHTQKSQKIITIKKGISRWVRFIKQKDGINKNLPLFIIIDELDRCRPDFAINLLEITKHIFNIPGVVFMIATDTEQLQHSIKVIYGDEFSANQYLSRFFDRRFLLPSPKMSNLIRTHTLKEILEEYDTKRYNLVPFVRTSDDFIENCSSIFEAFNLNLRDALKIYNRLIDQFLISERKFDASLFLILSCFYTLDPELYKHIKNNKDAKESIYYEKEINLKYNISESVTDVHYFYSSNGVISNNLSNVEVSMTLKEYLILTLNIIKITDMTANPFNERYAKTWKNGALNANKTPDTILKTAWADTKENNHGYNRSQYFELIELSTTLE